MTTDLRALTPQHPVLYRLAADGESLDFLYAQCPACGTLAFPANVPGCGHCGDPLAGAAQVAQAGVGTLLEYVTLHVPLFAGMEVPRIAADIQMQGGGIEEGVIAGTDESVLQHGMTLRAVAAALPGGQSFTCRFVPHTGASA